VTGALCAHTSTGPRAFDFLPAGGNEPTQMAKPNMDDITPDTLFEAVKLLSPQGRAELLAFLRTTALQLPPKDGETMARIADILELLLG